MGLYFGEDHPCDFQNKKCMEKIIKTLVEQYNAERPAKYHTNFEKLKKSLTIADCLTYIDKNMHTCRDNNAQS